MYKGVTDDTELIQKYISHSDCSKYPQYWNFLVHQSMWIACFARNKVFALYYGTVLVKKMREIFKIYRDCPLLTVESILWNRFSFFFILSALRCAVSLSFPKIQK